MSQFDFGNLESPLPGASFINDNLEPWRDALHSGHMGNSRPSYVVSGMWWIDNSSTPWVAKVFQGSDDIVVGTLDPSTLVFTPSGVATPEGEDVSVDNSSFNVLTGDNVQDVLQSVDDLANTFGTAAYEDVETVREIPQRIFTSNTTAQLSDSGGHLLHPTSDTTARTATIPANASVPFPINTAITFVNQHGAGVVTIAITTDTMRMAGSGATGNRTLTANGVATALKITATEWLISGTNLS